PDISFSTDNSCISTLSQFTSINTSGDITSYSWDFDGDGVEDSSDPNPSYQYQNIRGYDVRLSVDASTGCKNFITQNVQIYPDPPDPLITFGKSIFCQFEPITISNTTNDANYGDVLQYEWITSDMDTLVGKSPDFSFETPGQKIITIRSEIPGCRSDSIRRSLTVSTSPTMNFGASPTCFGEITTFTNLSQGVTFEWDFGDGFVGTQKNMSHIYSEPGNYTVKLEATNPNGCVNTLEKSVLVGAIPEAGFNYNIVCEDFESAFTDVSVVEGADIISWQWASGSEVFSTERNPKLLLEDEGDQVVSLTVDASNGCSSTYSEAVKVLPNADISLDVQIACFGDTSNVSEVLQNESIIFNRIWSINDVVLDHSESTFKYLFDETGTYEISLMVDTENLCSAETTKTIEIRPLPDLNIHLAADCENEPNILVDNTDDSFDPIVSRSWYLNESFVGNGKQVLLNNIEIGDYKAKLTATTQNGCVLEDSLDVTVLSFPQVDFSVSNNYDIPPFTTEFVNRSNNATSYNWYINEELMSDQRDFEFQFADFGLYSIKMVAQNQNGCRDSLIKAVNAVLPRIDMAIANISLDDNDNPQHIILDIVNAGNLPAEIFQINVEFQNDYQFTETVFQRVDFGTSSTVVINLDLPEGTKTDYLCARVISPFDEQEETPSDNEFCLDLIDKISFEPPYPNPTQNRTSIRAILNEPGQATISVIDLSGQIKTVKMVDGLEEGLNTFEIDLSNLDAGTYFISISHSDGTHHARIVKK
ncbi:MAG: PKD domain-containing protein, partial [Cyclobacteriaceae bacterium]